MKSDELYIISKYKYPTNQTFSKCVVTNKTKETKINNENIIKVIDYSDVPVKTTKPVRGEEFDQLLKEMGINEVVDKAPKKEIPQTSYIVI